MNTPFFEFWGKFMTHVARGQQQLDELSTWMKRGFTGADDLATLFRRCYGLNAPDTGGTQDAQAWQEAIAEFQNTFARFAAQWGWVTQAEHQQALDKCDALEKQVQAQQATIRQLQELLTQQGLGYPDLLQQMQGVLNDQSELFQAFMENIRRAYDEKP